jgi:hypothetical protein
VGEQRNLQVTPYVLGKVQRNGIEGSRTNWLGAVGGDIKYSIRPNLTLDLTANTDFAQVEVDEIQVNLDRFDLYYTEKRPFFLENAGLFSTGTAGATEIFYSRRIGLSSNGSEIPIFGGGRLTGKLGAMNVAFLDMQTAGVEGIAPSNNFTVGRVSRELPNRSSIGAIFTNRQGTGSLASDNDYNRVFAADGRWGIGKYGLLSGYVARSVTPGILQDQYAFRLNAAYDSPGWNFSSEYAEVANNFNPEVGFLSRKGYRYTNSRIERRIRPENFLGILQSVAHIIYRGYWDYAGFQETGFLHICNKIDWRNGYALETSLNLKEDGLKKPFGIHSGVTVPPGVFRHSEGWISIQTNQAAWLSFSSGLRFGGYYGGSKVSWEPTIKYREGDTFSSQLTWSLNQLDLPGGKFQTNLVKMRLSYSFTPRIFIQALAQYNDAGNVWAINARFGWLSAANTGLFVVYNESRDIHQTALDIPERSLTIKISRLFDLLD